MSERAFADHFASVSAGYATYRPAYPRELFAALAGVSPSTALAWDCGCGTGQASVALAEFFDEVDASDASAAQIAQATPHARVTYGVVPAEESGFPDASVSLITVAQALHWFDVDAFHVEARRVLVPRGVIAEWTYALLQVPSSDAVTALIRDFDVEMHPYWPPERRFVDRNYIDFAFPFEPISLGDFAMHAEWSREQLLGFLGTWSAVARCRQQTANDPLVAVAEKLAVAWVGTTTREIRWPMTLRVGRV